MRDFTKGHNEKELSLFLLPMILSLTFQRIYSLINTAVVSKYLNYQAVAVIGSCQACVSIQEFIFMGMTTGFGFYIFRCIGSKEKQVLSGGVWGAVYLTAVLALAGLAACGLTGFFMEFMDISPQLQKDAGRYLFFLIAGSGFLGFKNLLFCTVQGLGDSRFPGILSMAGVVSQTVLTVWLIAGMRLGVEASALAVLLNNLFLCLCLLAYLFRHYRKRLGYTPPARIAFPVFRELLGSGAVKSGMMIFVGIGMIPMQKAINKMPDVLLAANTYATVISAFFMYVMNAYATAAGVIAGQNRGNRNAENIKKYNRSIFARCVCACILVFLLFHIGGRQVIGILAGQDVPGQVILAGEQWLRICSYGYPGLMLLLVCRNVMQAMGYHRLLPALGFAEMAVNIILAGFVPLYAHRAVAVSMVLKWSIPGVISYFGYRKSIREFTAEITDR